MCLATAVIYCNFLTSLLGPEAKQGSWAPHLYRIDLSASTASTGNDPKAAHASTSTPSKVDDCHSPSAAGSYLPGSDEYRKLMGNNIAGNPRGDTPVRQWLKEWEKEWKSLTDEPKSCSMCRPF